MANDNIITHGRDFFPSMTDPPIITGSNGNTHGARIVSNPATNESINKLMVRKKILKNCL